MNNNSRRKKRRRIRTSYIWAGIMVICALAALFAAIWVVITVYEKIAGDSSEWAALESSEETTSSIEIVAEDVYGWITDEKGSRYREEDGTFAADTWKVWEDQLYYLNPDGYMTTEDVSMDGQVFLFDENGALTDIQLDTGWVGLTGEDNLQNLDSLVKGRVFWAYRSSDTNYTGSFRPICYRKTTETEEQFLGGTSNPEMTTEHSMQIHGDYLYYLPQVTTQTLSSLSKDEQELCNKLFRMKPGDSVKELLAENVTGYLVMEDGGIYYASGGQIQKADHGTQYAVGEEQFRVQVKDGSCYLIDSMGNMAPGDAKGLQVVGDRVYRLDEGKILEVYPAERKYGETIYTLEADTKNSDKKAIYKREAGGSKTLAAQSAYGINSFCLADGALYYSAYIDRGGDGTRYSAIYRLAPGAAQAEQISERFEGNILNLYYFEGKQKIYGEYTPTSWKNCYGQIAVIDLDGTVRVIDDSASRGNSDKDSNELLSLVMVDGNTVTAYVKTCEYSKGSWKVLSEKPIQFADTLQTEVAADSREEDAGGKSESEESSKEDLKEETETERPSEVHVEKPTEKPAETKTVKPAETPSQTQQANPQGPGYEPTVPPTEPVGPGYPDSGQIPTVEANPESGRNGPGGESGSVKFIGPGGAS